MGAPGEEWTREITDDVVRYWDTTSPDDYLRLRAAEVLPTTPTGLAPDTQPGTPGPESPLGGGASGPSEDGIRELFISHASEDKDGIARPLANELRRRGHSVWFDEYELVLGDSLRRNIDRGLAQSTVGVVVLSHAFFAKPWPQRELDGLVARMTSGEENVILPIWHELTHSDLVGYSPPLADLLAASSDQGVESLADQIELALERRHLHIRRSLAQPETTKAGERTQGAATSDASISTEPTGVHHAVQYLNDDLRRWIYDRDHRLRSDLAYETESMNARGLLQSSIHLSAVGSLRRQALQDYRDEMSAIRRRYREVYGAAPAGSDVPHLALDDASREILTRWRSPATVPGMNDQAPVDDPTDESSRARPTRIRAFGRLTRTHAVQRVRLSDSNIQCPRRAGRGS